MVIAVGGSNRKLLCAVVGLGSVWHDSSDSIRMGAVTTMWAGYLGFRFWCVSKLFSLPHNFHILLTRREAIYSFNKRISTYVIALVISLMSGTLFSYV
jgi:hypothetical protein